jgi:hypothetical protein
MLNLFGTLPVVCLSCHTQVLHIWSQQQLRLQVHVLQGAEFRRFSQVEPRTTVAILLVTSFNALAYNVVHYKMIAVRCCLAMLSLVGVIHSADRSNSEA